MMRANDRLEEAPMRGPESVAKVTRSLSISILWCGVALALGCSSGAGNGRDTPLPKPMPRAPIPGAGGNWSVQIGEQGGFTGGGGGYVIAASGQVQAWSRVVPGDSVTTTAIGIASATILAELEAAMRDPELLASNLQETGNMTAFLEWRQPPQVRHWSWPEQGRATKIPPAVQRAVVAAQAAVASARAAADASEDER